MVAPVDVGPPSPGHLEGKKKIKLKTTVNDLILINLFTEIVYQERWYLEDTEPTHLPPVLARNFWRPDWPGLVFRSEQQTDVLFRGSPAWESQTMTRAPGHCSGKWKEWQNIHVPTNKHTRREVQYRRTNLLRSQGGISPEWVFLTRWFGSWQPTA